MTSITPAGQPVSRRGELLELAATMFAERGLRATTVRDIADSAGILSGSLYHHFRSKEEMVDEVLSGFLDWLFDRYQEIIDTQPNPLERLKGLFLASFEAIEDRHAQVVIYQEEAKRLSLQSRFAYVEELNKRQRQMWVDVLNQGIEQGYFRPDIDVDVVYRFIRDTTWVSVHWYRPGGPLTASQVGDQYLAIVLGGIAATNTSKSSATNTSKSSATNTSKSSATNTSKSSATNTSKSSATNTSKNR